MELSERLRLIASLVPSGKSVCDVGTDHAYLPIALSLRGDVRQVTATDVREKPLENARKNVKAASADGVKLVLCDGLDGVSRKEADTVIIAGMGGEVISGIIDRCRFSRDKDILFILQPMSSAVKLRDFLAENGFYTESEYPVCENGKIYSVMCVRYDGVLRKLTAAQRFAGCVSPETKYGRAYIEKQISICTECAEALKNREEKRREYLMYVEAVREIRQS